MAAVKLVLACCDEQYIEPFLYYVRFSEHQYQITVTAFSQKEAFMQYMDEVPKPVQIILAEPSFLEGMETTEGEINVLYLTEDNCPDDPQCIYKYQPLPNLVSAIMGRTSSGKGGKSIPSVQENNLNTNLVSLYSAQGGAGKTTVALNLCKQLSMQGIRAFYLNLESVYASPLFHKESQTSSAGLGLSRLLYDLKRQEAGGQGQVERLPLSAYVDRPQLLQADTFSLSENINEVLQMGRTEIYALIDFIMDSQLYDIVIADIDSEQNARTQALLERSNQIIWLATEDWSGLQKAEVVWSESVDEFIRAKSLLVLNKFTGQGASEVQLGETTSILNLSYIPGWNEGNQVSGVLHSPLFQRDILRLSRVVCQQEILT